MGLLDDFIAGYQGATQKANEALGEYFEDYKTWASRNKEALPGAINKFGEYIDKVANLPGADMVVPMGALWKNTEPFLQQINILRGNQGTVIKPETMNILQRLTESFPQVERAGLKATEDRILGSHWHPPEFLSESPFSWSQKSNPGIINISSRVTNSPTELTYGHEAAHAITGPQFDWVNPLFPSQPTHVTVQPARGAMEGFAEGFSHGILDRFNKDAISGYWRKPYSGTGFRSLASNHPASIAFNRGGELGADLGSYFRRGGIIEPQEPVDELHRIIKQITDAFSQ